MLQSLKELFQSAADGLALYATSGALCPVTEEVAKVHVELQRKLAAKAKN